MKRISILSVVLVIVLALSTGMVLSVEGTQSQEQEGSSAGGFVSSQDREVDRTITRVILHTDSSATMEIEILTRLENETEIEAFERFQEKVEQNESKYISDFAEGVRNLVSNAEQRTGREMEASDFSIETELTTIPRERGIVRYTFNWSNFSTVAGDRISVEETLGGYILSEGDSLVISYPEGYQVEEVTPQPDDTGSNSVTWEARNFATDEPRIILIKSSGDGGGSDGGDGGDGTSDGSDGDGGGSDGGDGASDGGDGTDDGTDDGSSMTNFLLVVVAIVVVAGGYIWIRSQGGVESVTKPQEAQTDQTESEIQEAGVEEGEEEETDEIDEFENLSDTEKVLHILESEDGRIKQKTLVEEVGWSEAKVSQVTSKMEDEGQIEKLRMGRENIIQLNEGDEDIVSGGQDEEGGESEDDDEDGESGDNKSDLL